MRGKILRAASLLCLLYGCFGWSVSLAFEAPTLAEKYPQTITRELFRQLAIEALEKKLKEIDETRRHEIKALREPMDMNVPAGKLKTEVAIPKELRYGHRVPVVIRVLVNGKFYRRATCYLGLRVYDKVLVTKRRVKLEGAFTQDDVALEEREVENRGEIYLKDSSAVAGMVAARAISEGTILTKNMLHYPMVIEMGATVTVKKAYRGVEVSIEGVALERGRIGSIIRVRNAKSGKALRARVVDASTVEAL